MIKKFIRDYKRNKAAGAGMRPLWQIPLILLVFLLYWPARAFVDFCDNNL